MQPRQGEGWFLDGFVAKRPGDSHWAFFLKLMLKATEKEMGHPVDDVWSIQVEAAQAALETTTREEAARQG